MCIRDSFNIGAEGQVIVGMFATGYIGFTWPHLPPVILLPLAILGGTLAGALWSGLPGLLKARLGVHEAVSYTHLDVYKRQILKRPQRKAKATASPVKISGVT